MKLYEDEAQFLAWGDGPAGPWVKILLNDSDALGPFRGMTAAKKNMAGQLLRVTISEIGGAAPDGERQEPGVKGGPLSKLAGLWCQDPEFSAWLAENFRDTFGTVLASPQMALQGDDAAKNLLWATAETVRRICGVRSRAELDHNQEARTAFNLLIREPYGAILAERHAGREPGEEA